MKKFLIALVLLAALAAAAAIYLVVGTPTKSRGVRFPLTDADRELIAKVPSDAESFAFVPDAAAFQQSLEKNPVTREALRRFAQEQPLPRPWMIGRGDLLMWKSGKETKVFLRLEPFRALLARLYMALIAGDAAPRVMLVPPSGEPVPAAEMDTIVGLANHLPPGDALTVQRKGGRGAYPPIGRPAVTSVSINARAIDLVSRAGREEGREDGLPPATTPLLPRYPRDAAITAAFASAPRLARDANRLFGFDVAALLGAGGAAVIYDVEEGSLLPRPRGVIVLPNTPERRAEIQGLVDRTKMLRDAVGATVETAEAGTELLVAFDRQSIPRYRAGHFDRAQLAANAWSLRVDPRQAEPLLDRLASSTALRFVTPRIQKASKDVRSWVDSLQSAASVEAGAVATEQADELRVRISAK